MTTVTSAPLMFAVVTMVALSTGCAIAPKKMRDPFGHEANHFSCGEQCPPTRGVVPASAVQAPKSTDEATIRR